MPIARLLMMRMLREAVRKIGRRWSTSEVSRKTSILELSGSDTTCEKLCRRVSARKFARRMTCKVRRRTSTQKLGRGASAHVFRRRTWLRVLGNFEANLLLLLIMIAPILALEASRIFARDRVVDVVVGLVFRRLLGHWRARLLVLLARHRGRTSSLTLMMRRLKVDMPQGLVREELKG